MPTTFLRLLAADDKAAALADAVAATRAGSCAPDTHTVDPTSFQQVPGSPFAYWVSESMRNTFAAFSTLEPTRGIVKQGLATADDFRFVRGWWEIAAQSVATGGNGIDASDLSQETLRGKRWAAFAKGGAFSRYYNDPHLLVNWESRGQEIKLRIDPRTGKPFSNVWQLRGTEADFFFRPGLTYPRRTNGFSVRAMPAGCIFADKGPAIFVKSDSTADLFALLAIVSSQPFNKLLSLLLGRVELAQSFEVGLIQQMPVPGLSPEDQRVLALLAREAHDLKRNADRDDEVTHPFTVPALGRLLYEQPTIAAALDTLAAEEQALQRRLAAIQAEIDDRCFALYGFSPEDRAQVEQQGQRVAGQDEDDTAAELAEEDVEEEGDETGKNGNGTVRGPKEVANLLMYALGCAFGRWDVRIGRDPSLAPALADPFTPLPVCAPGALVGSDGLPATPERVASEEWVRARPDAITLPPASSAHNPAITADDYPLPVAWDGILVDDPDAPNDIVLRVRSVLDYLWGEQADAVEREACAILGIRDLRDYFRNPRAFFDFHIGRYSKSRRKAPIYWLLQSPKRSYAIWLYYHRLDADLVFKALNFHLLPKIRLEKQRLGELKAAKEQAGMTGAEARRAAQSIDRQEALLADLREFRDALDRAARHYLTPDLNDGVLLNIAPFCEVVPWKEAKATWQQLLTGKYEWSIIGRQLREKGYVRGK